MKLHVSNGNSKLGKIPNISLVPVKDCINSKHCAKECYALKALRMYPSVKKAWSENSNLLRKNPKEFTKQLNEFLEKKKPAYFRYNVAGDVSEDYIDIINLMAQVHIKTKFLLFTKAYKLLPLFLSLPNLSIVVSAWDSQKVTEVGAYAHKFSFAYAGDCSQFGDRYTQAIECPGRCDDCFACWGLAQKKLDVKFKKH